MSYFLWKSPVLRRILDPADITPGDSAIVKAFVVSKSWTADVRQHFSSFVLLPQGLWATFSEAALAYAKRTASRKTGICNYRGDLTSWSIKSVLQQGLGSLKRRTIDKDPWIWDKYLWYLSCQVTGFGQPAITKNGGFKRGKIALPDCIPKSSWPV